MTNLEGIISSVSTNSIGEITFVSVTYIDPDDSSKAHTLVGHRNYNTLKDLKIGDVVSFVAVQFEQRRACRAVRKVGTKPDIIRAHDFLMEDIRPNLKLVKELNFPLIVGRLLSTSQQINEPADLYNYFARVGLEYAGTSGEKFFFYAL